MKLAISNIAWKSHENLKMYSLLKSYQVDGLEVAPAILFPSDAPYDVSQSKLSETKNYLYNDFNLKICSMQSLLFGTKNLQLFESSNSKVKMLDYLKKSIRFAGALGGRNLVFGSPKNRLKNKLSMSEAIDRSKSFFYELSEEAEQNNTFLSIEANALNYGADFVTQNDEAMALIKAVNHPHFKLNYDASTVQLNGENYTQFISEYQKFIHHVHFSNPFLESVPGPSQEFFEKLYKALKDSNYEGYISVEMKSKSDNNSEHVEMALRFLSGLR